MDAGQLDRRVEIYQQGSKDDYAAPAPVLVRRCWAKILRSTGKETPEDDSDKSEVSITFRVRRSPVMLDRKMFLRYKGFDYEITYIDDVTSDGYLDIYCNLITRKAVPV